MATVGYLVHVEAFNRTLRTLMTDLARRLPGDAEFWRAHRRIAMAISFDPLAAIGDVGFYLYRYRAQIRAPMSDFFLRVDFDGDLGASENPEKAAIVADLIPKLQAVARGLSASELAEYREAVIDLLTSYLEFRLARAGAAS